MRRSPGTFPMLTGRESLVRLIGKRRRFLPNRHSLLSSASAFQSCLNLGTDEGGKIVSLEGREGLSFPAREVKDLGDGVENGECASKTPASDWVTCPVCGKRVRGGDYGINLHLDTCLTRGTKRKVTQRTLLQLNFSPRLKVKVCPVESDLEQSTVDVVCNNPHEDLVNGGHECDRVENGDGFPENGDGLLLNGCARSLGSECQIARKVRSASLSPKKVATHCDISVDDEDIFGTVVDTFIVGRKFSDEKELKLGMAISLLREPENVKDPSAIKVLSADSGCCLGYLPRSLAQYVSPLIEKHCLSFEGSVTCLPNHNHDIVPIKICCHGMIPCGEGKHDDVDGIKCLWTSILQEVEAARKNPPSMTKYQQNFSLLIHEVLIRSSNLFTDDEKLFMESFTSLLDDSQRLFVRLYSRKGPWFRLSNISYPEISDALQAVNELSGKGYVVPFDCAEGLQTDEMMGILRVLTVSELREISCIPKKKGSQNSTKKDLIASALCSYRDGLCPVLPSVLLDKAGVCVKISSRAETVFWRAERIFFLNGEQDLSTFLLVDLGAVKYPTYNCTNSEQIFSSRSCLLDYEEAIEVAQLMDESLDQNDADQVLRCLRIADSCVDLPSENVSRSSISGSEAAFISCFTASWVYSKVILLGISYLEREHRYQDAINLLKRLLDCFISDGRRGYWTVRLSIDLEHLGFLDESLSVAEDGLLDPWVRAGSRIALQKRVLRLGKPPRRWKIPRSFEITKWKIKEVHVQGRPLNCEMGKKSRFYGEDGEQCGVEQLALQYYANEGGCWSGVHTESGIWLTIFGLLMWDVIFSDVPNVFRTKFQTAPLDLETDGFFLARKGLIETHLQNIHDGMAEEILITSWESHLGTACRGVNWDRHSLSELRAAVTCVGGPCLASLCRLLSQDYRSWSSGMPDLLLWRFHGEYRGEAKLVEVKGPNDRLSEQQRAWLFILMECGFNAEVCKVTPPLPLEPNTQNIS
ncbi:fanconi-associated nuclease 1 homolog isoform X1 [Eucalyptus grandis]|uniref:fanconi-associated nuclease 1 homolog isoform X1 n=1 Tax=Eucalyptus grandis TaxID=71139 RepID=UPI00192EE30C|nr:fanconi-associated nuclease 1 homolog isoform X1 [Eucalyptus grandis]